MNVEIQILTADDGPQPSQKDEVADFLFEHLDQYGDPRQHIMKAIDYALGTSPGKGGFVVVARKEGKVVGAVIMNETHMGGYIPENILVYIAVDGAHRGEGIGGQLMKHALEHSTGDVALHVEPDNPACKLYEKVGFTNKYLEMRYSKD